MLIQLESFNHYATADLAGKFSTVGAPTGTGSGGAQTIAAVGPRGTTALRQVGAGLQTSGYVSKVASHPAPVGQICLIGFLFRCVTPFASEFPATAEASGALVVCRRSGVTQWWARVNQNGTISVLRGSTVLASTVTALLQNTQQYVELKVKIDPAAGTIDARIDGVSALPTATGLNTQGGANTAWDEWRLGPAANKDSSANTVEHQFADLYVADGSGGVCNDFSGPLRVDVLLPIAAGAHSDFVRSTGADQFATIDDITANGDTDYNASSAVGSIDTLRFPPAPVAGAPILGVQLVTQARKEDAGTATQQGIARIGSIDYAVGGLSVPAAYGFLVEPMATKPNDGSPWVGGDIAGAEFGYKKTS